MEDFELHGSGRNLLLDTVPTLELKNQGNLISKSIIKAKNKKTLVTLFNKNLSKSIKRQ
jgi:hypothetical protein